jgi:hypothetical protein
VLEMRRALRSGVVKLSLCCFCDQSHDWRGDLFGSPSRGFIPTRPDYRITRAVRVPSRLVVQRPLSGFALVPISGSKSIREGFSARDFALGFHYS